MSDVKNTVSKANSPRKGDAAGSVSPARARQFHETEQRMKAQRSPSLANVELLAPSDDQIALISARFGLDVADVDEMIGLGLSAVRDQYEALRPVLVTSFNGEDDFKAIKIHLDRIVDALVRSAHGAANYYETRRQLAKDAKDKWANEHRDDDRMGIDGQDNYTGRLRRVAAEHAVKAYALYHIASGACTAYAEVMGEEWQPYQSRANNRTVSQEAAAALDEALGI
ncbi:hypothetical protein GOB83_14245 [Acetobacter fabarum]|jgi:hypothetical protein|uniref:hypothetical protein n=1 Tax=Acetobacter TaxID=434 RepID=UPI001405026E|nr:MULTISPECIES: hypothetical protein [Acetobacter]MCP1240664.1 hypothetical protein [Acetobacter lovaniensis]NHO43306.1 hypothetical protein [Acetobacter fabarum]